MLLKYSVIQCGVPPTSDEGSPIFLHLLVFLHIPDLHLPLQVPKPGQDQDVTLRTEDQKDTVRTRVQQIHAHPDRSV